MINPQDIATADDLPRKKVETLEWEPKTPHVFVRMFDAPELVAMNGYNKNDDGTNNEEKEAAFLWRFAAFVLCQEDGARVYTDKQADEGVLQHKNPKVLQRIVEEAQAHNGMTKESREEAVKNSESGQTDSNT